VKELLLPQEEKAESISNFVIVGANGSGKSHLGAWLEKHQNQEHPVLRISAQRALEIPERVILMNEERSWNMILSGSEELRKDYDVTVQRASKWHYDKFTTTLVNDFNSVLSAMFARANNENHDYVALCRDCESRGENKPSVPKLLFDRFRDIWDSVFPHRGVEFKDAQVMALYTRQDDAPPTSYLGSGMSDGERVTIYLIGQCLVAPSGSMIIIDEPEIHLHKLIMHRLWDAVEKHCADKTFVYITHDLEFASSRRDATKIWVKSYHGEAVWDLSILSPNDTIPDGLYLEVLGSRKPILFVEGAQDSYDVQLYSYIYPDYSVIPCGSCKHVIAMTTAFNKPQVAEIHNNKVRGIIDRDYLSQEEQDSLNNTGVFILPVAEVENLFLLEGVVRCVSRTLRRNENEDFLRVKTYVFEEFEKELDNQVLNMWKRELKHKISVHEPICESKESLVEGLHSFIDTLNVQRIYEDHFNKVNEIVEQDSYDQLLSIYNRKTLPSRISPKLGLGKDEYPKFVLRLLREDEGAEIISAMRDSCPLLE